MGLHRQRIMQPFHIAAELNPVKSTKAEILLLFFVLYCLPHVYLYVLAGINPKKRNYAV